MKAEKEKVKLTCSALLDSYSQGVSGKSFLFLVSFLVTRVYSEIIRSLLDPLCSS